MEIENNEMVVRLRFDRSVSDEEAARMAGVMAEEMEFRDPSGGRYTSPGWGIGKARVLGVTQLLPGDLAEAPNPLRAEFTVIGEWGDGLEFVQDITAADVDEACRKVLAERKFDPGGDGDLPGREAFISIVLSGNHAAARLR